MAIRPYYECVVVTVGRHEWRPYEIGVLLFPVGAPLVGAPALNPRRESSARMRVMRTQFANQGESALRQSILSGTFLCLAHASVDDRVPTPGR